MGLSHPSRHVAPVFVRSIGAVVMNTQHRGIPSQLRQDGSEWAPRPSLLDQWRELVGDRWPSLFVVAAVGSLSGVIVTLLIAAIAA